MLCNKSFSNKLDMAMQKIKNLEDSVNKLAEKLTEFDNQSLTFAEKIAQLIALFDSCFKLVQEENVLATQYAWRQYDELHHQFVLELVIQDLKSKVGELQKEQEHTMGQHAEEGRLAEERTRKLESVAERLSEMETLIATLEEKITTTLRLPVENMKDLMLRFSELEIENQVNSGNLLSEIQKKEEEIGILKEQIEKQKQHVNSLDEKVEHLNGALKEKDDMVSKYEGREKELEDKIAQTDKLLGATGSGLSNATMKESELSRCLEGSILPLQSKNANLVRVRTQLEIGSLYYFLTLTTLTLVYP